MTVYVFGHRNPDTDAICAALAYADLLQRTSRPDAVGRLLRRTQPAHRVCAASRALGSTANRDGCSPRFGGCLSLRIDRGLRRRSF
ncbi:MAG: DHH family phosphoesterase [Pirellulaceae bacterium]